jgi:alpha-beta hydrolase superfamily lysophospholipase
LFLYGQKDEIIPKETMLDVYRRLPGNPNAHKELIVYEDGYHMLLRDLQAEKVMQDIVAWDNEQDK